MPSNPNEVSQNITRPLGSRMASIVLLNQGMPTEPVHPSRTAWPLTLPLMSASAMPIGPSGIPPMARVKNSFSRERDSL